MFIFIWEKLEYKYFQLFSFYYDQENIKTNSTRKRKTAWIVIWKLYPHNFRK